MVYCFSKQQSHAVAKVFEVHIHVPCIYSTCVYVSRFSIVDERIYNHTSKQHLTPVDQIAPIHWSTKLQFRIKQNVFCRV